MKACVLALACRPSAPQAMSHYMGPGAWHMWVSSLHVG